HLLESTSIPLELYFEHRNYLPAMLLFWPLARALCNWKFPQAPRIAIAIVLLAICAITTYQRTELWGKPDKLAALWAIQNPDSSRAQATEASADLKAGRNAEALQKLAPLWKQRPHDLQIAFNTINAACAVRGLNDADKNALAEALRHTPNGQLLMYRWIGNAIGVADAHACPGLTLDDIEHWIDASLQNPAIGNPHIRGQNIEPLLAQIAISRKQPDLALLHFNNALAAMTTPDVAARQASALAEAGYYEQALAHLDTYERLKSRVRQHGPGMQWLHAKVLEWENYWPFEMARLRKKLHEAIAERDAGMKNPQ
ncbi:MAG: tetratricopeptide repeat protein, partial [Lysobacteraceae bacterium]